MFVFSSHNFSRKRFTVLVLDKIHKSFFQISLIVEEFIDKSKQRIGAEVAFR